MARPLSLMVALLVWIFTAATLLAEADPLALIPEDALGVGLVNHLADTNGRVLKLTQKMKIPVPGLLPMAQLYTNVKEGLDYKGTLAAALFTNEDEDAESGYTLAIFVPTTDYKELIKQLEPADADAATTKVTVAGEEYLVAKKADFAVFVDGEQKELLEKIVANSKGLSATFEPLRSWIDAQQAAIVVTPKGKKVLFEKIGDFLGTGAASFGKLDEEMQDDADQDDDKDDDADKDDAGKDDADDDDDDGKPTSQAAAQLKTLRELMEGIKQLLPSAEEQLTHLALGVRIDDQTALHVAARALFTPQGRLSKWAKDVKLPKGGLLAGLPDGKFVISYGLVWADTSPEISKLVNWAMQNGLDQLGMTEEQSKKYFEVLSRQRGNQVSTCGMFGSLRPGDSLAATSLTVEYVKDASAHIKLTRESFEFLKSLKLPGRESTTPIYELNEVNMGDLKALEVTTNMNALIGAGEDNEAAQQAQGFFAKLFGNGGVMKAYLAAANDHAVVTAYSKELLERGVAHVRSGAAGLEADPQITNTVALLPAGAQWAAYISPQGLMQLIDSVMRDLMGGQMAIKIPPFPPSDPIGLAAKVEEAGLDAELVLPSSVVAGIGQYIMLIQQMMQNEGAPLP